MVEELDFTLQLPALKELTQIRIARSLWCSQDWTENDMRYIPLRNKLKSQISVLPIPKPFQKDLEKYVHFVGKQISDLELRFYHLAVPDLANLIRNDYFNNGKLRWTAYGTVDVFHVAGLFMRDERVPIDKRYAIACQYCMQEDIERLWPEMEPEEKKLKNIESSLSVSSGLVDYWSCPMKGKRQRFYNYPPVDLRRSLSENWFHIITQNRFECDYNEFSVEYFWNQMTEVEKKRQIERLNYDGNFVLPTIPIIQIEVWRYLLSLMDLNEQTAILKRFPAIFLKMFLNRPWQHLFFPVLRLVEGCQTFKDALPRFLDGISLDQCDEAMRRRFFDHLRPLFPKYIYNNRLPESWCISKLQEDDRDYVLEVMRDATEAQKIDFIMKTFDHCGRIYASHASLLNVFVEAWVRRDGWPNLKVKLNGILDQSRPWRRDCSKELRELIDSIDEHFAS